MAPVAAFAWQNGKSANPRLRRASRAVRRFSPGGGVVRNMDVTPEGNIALACSGVNRIALADVK